ncbi:MAG: type I secretion system permease/ATPase [Pseudomonadota bacterium]
MVNKYGREELRGALKECRRHFRHVGIFSIFVNLLMLTGPLFMLQVYDRVLSSRSEETLLTLLLLVTALFFFMGVLDFIRGRVLARAGAKFSTILEERVFVAVMRRSMAPGERARPNMGARDLDSIRQLLAGPAPFALFDVPWVPIYFGAIFLFDPLLAATAVVGALILVVLTIINQFRSSKPNHESQIATAEAENLSEQLRQNAEAVQGLGMMPTGMRRWHAMREKALNAQILASDRTASYTSASKSLRFYLQSLILAVGAYLVLQGRISPGMMIAGSILMGRALAPIEQAISQWSLMQRAARAWFALSEMLERTPPEAEKTQLPPPKGFVSVQNVTVIAPGEQAPALRGVNFELKPGQALGVIGPSGSGKTTLAKILTGIWRPAAGKVRIDGAATDQWRLDDLGSHIGYLPQEIGLLSGSVAHNIARLAEEPDDEKVIDAARRAGANELLLGLPQGYDTEIGAGGQRLSGGQRQRVALARALYDDPPLIVLDEPNANLDAQGEQALVDSIRDARARGRTVIIMAHRPSAIAACDLLLMIDQGQQVDFGPRDEVLKRRTKNYAQLAANQQVGQQGGATPKIAAPAATPGTPPGAAAARPAGAQAQPGMPLQPNPAASASARPAAQTAAQTAAPAKPGGDDQGGVLQLGRMAMVDAGEDEGDAAGTDQSSGQPSARPARQKVAKTSAAREGMSLLTPSEEKPAHRPVLLRPPPAQTAATAAETKPAAAGEARETSAGTVEPGDASPGSTSPADTKAGGNEQAS